MADDCERVVLEMTAGDNDSFVATVEGVDLSTATAFRLRMQRPSGTLDKDGTDIGELPNGKFLVTFDDASDLEYAAGAEQKCVIQWVIAGELLSSDAFFILVDEAIPAP